MSHGYLMLRRSEATYELLKDLNAFVLLTVIALRAKRTTSFSVHGLKAGQALVGDFQACGLTEGQYRAAKARLKRYGLADFKGTPRGTVATLLNNAVYDINARPTTSQRRTGNGRATTNNNEKKGKKGNKPAPPPEAGRLARLLFDLIREQKADFPRPNLDRWARDIDRMIRLERRDPARIEAVLRWCRGDPFWQSNILSGGALRRQFDRLELQMARETPRESVAAMARRMEREGKL